MHINERIVIPFNPDNRLHFTDLLRQTTLAHPAPAIVNLQQSISHPQSLPCPRISKCADPVKYII